MTDFKKQIDKQDEIIPLCVRNGSFMPSDNTANLLDKIGGHEIIYDMTRKFYEHAFIDKHIQKFVTDTNEPHGQRLGAWIIEKMSAEPVWSNELNRHGLRASSHSKAWHSSKRPKAERGRRFKLDDCRIWMRLMFWSAREVGLDKYPAFFNWFVRFIAHFIRVYEWSAPPYANNSADWSTNERNIERYIANGYIMKL